MDQKFCTTIVSADPRKSLRPRESHPGVIQDDPGLSRIKTFDRAHSEPRSRELGLADLLVEHGGVEFDFGHHERGKHDEGAAFPT